MSMGLWVMFGIVLIPLYVTLLGWFLGKPRDYRTAGIGVGVMAGLLLLMLLGAVIPFTFQVIIPG